MLLSIIKGRRLRSRSALDKALADFATRESPPVRFALIQEQDAEVNCLALPHRLLPAEESLPAQWLLQCGVLSAATDLQWAPLREVGRNEPPGENPEGRPNDPILPASLW